MEALDTVEASRGFGPPVMADIRIWRSGRAQGFLAANVERHFVGRYKHFEDLGNLCVLTREDGIRIKNPSAAGDLLDLAIVSATSSTRVVFFCACLLLSECHRQEVGRQVLAQAKRRGIVVEVVEWPEGEPLVASRDVDLTTLMAVRKSRKSVPVMNPGPEDCGLPWGSVVHLAAGAEIQPIISGPAKYSNGWYLPVLGRPMAGASPRYLYAQGQAYRRSNDLDGKIVTKSKKGGGMKACFSSCIYTIRDAETLDGMIKKQGGGGELVYGQSWRTGLKFFEDARKEGKRLLVFFGDAATNPATGIIWAAEVEGISIEAVGKSSTTKLTVSALRKLAEPDRFKVTDLKLRKTGLAIAPNFIRAYALCVTPAKYVIK
jgi:hypothetical protein